MEIPDGGGREDDRVELLGGADAVQKTTYVEGRGTDPDAESRPGTVARMASGTLMDPVVWAVIAIAILVALVYGFGIPG